jgi:transposase
MGGFIVTTTPLPPVETQTIGFAPILKFFFEESGVQKIIDQHVPLDPRRKILTHGQAGVTMVTAILCQVFQMYRLCRFAEKSQILNVIFPDIASKEYFDDRMADTLDAIYDYGIGNLEMLITRHMINHFDIRTTVAHNDTTSASTYGNCNKHPGEGITITYGYSKKHRQDLKQFVWSLSVSNDGAFPLFQQAYSGNTADVTTYVEQWQNLIDLLDDRNFLYVGDCKLASVENMTHIHDNQGFFLSPAPRYLTYEDAFEKALQNRTEETLIPYKGRFNRGFETPLTLCYNDKEYPFRMIILFDHGLCARTRQTLNRHVENTRVQFDKQALKLNAYNLKTREGIEKACHGIFRKNNSRDFFDFEIQNEPVTIYKNARRGRSSKNGDEKVAITKDHFTVRLIFHPEIFDKALWRCGYYPLITNKNDISFEEAMQSHKDQYKNEHTNRRAKSSLNLEPIYLQTPKRIEAMLFLFKIALQLAVLIERGARQAIKARDKGLDNFMPNRKNVTNPTTENLLAEFKDIVKGIIELPSGQAYGFVSKLTDIQKDILAVLGIPQHYFNYAFLYNST